jgi:hypothetical protein
LPSINIDLQWLIIAKLIQESRFAIKPSVMNRLRINNIAFIYYPQVPAGSYYLLLVIGSFLGS